MAEPNAADDTEEQDIPAPAAGGEGGDITPKTDVKPDEGTEGEDGLEPAKPEDGEPVIPVRRSAASFIIARKNKKIEKLQSQSHEDDADDEPADEPATPATISREVQRQVEPLIKSIAGQVDEGELGELFASEPESKKLEKTIRVYMQHPAYQGVAPSVIYHHLAFAASQAKGAKKRTAADLEAGQARGAGSGRRPTSENISGIPSAEEIENMIPAEFEKLQHKVRTGKFLPK